MRDDIKYNYSSTRGYALGQSETVGRIAFIENGEKHDYANDYYVYSTYTKTIEFLNDPGNFAAGDVETGLEEAYSFMYNRRGLSLDVSVSKEDTSDAAKELRSYVRPGNADDYDPQNDIRIIGRSSNITYTINKADEQRVVELMLTLFLEKHMTNNS